MAGKLLNRKKAAQYLGVSAQTLLGITEKYNLPVVRASRMFLYHKKDLDALLTSKALENRNNQSEENLVLFNRESAIKYLSVTPYLLDRSKIPYERNGRQKIYRKEDLDKYLEKHTRPMPVPQENPNAKEVKKIYSSTMNLYGHLEKLEEENRYIERYLTDSNDNIAKLRGAVHSLTFLVDELRKKVNGIQEEQDAEEDFVDQGVEDDEECP